MTSDLRQYGVTHLNHGVWILVGGLVDGVTQSSSRAVTQPQHNRQRAVAQLTPCPEERRDISWFSTNTLPQWALYHARTETQPPPVTTRSQGTHLTAYRTAVGRGSSEVLRHSGVFSKVEKSVSARSSSPSSQWAITPNKDLHQLQT